MNLEYILFLLIECAENNIPLAELIKMCEEKDVKKTEYINLHGINLYNNGYSYLFKTENNENCRLDIIEADRLILQSGFQIYYKSKLFFSNIHKDFKYILNLLHSLYNNTKEVFDSKGIVIKQINPNYLEFYEFANANSQGYVTKDGKFKTLTFRITNKEIWNKYKSLLYE